MARRKWTSDWQTSVRVRLERSGATILGEGRADLLTAIERHLSITKAAKASGMSYRRAWTMVQAMNAAAGEPLVQTAAGGPAGGGARLTPSGRLALQVYQQVRNSVVASAAGALQRVVHSDLHAPPVIHLAAAISLQEAVGQLISMFALQQPTVKVRTIFGASNELADLMLSGAPGDLFISAEPKEIDRLAARGLVVAGARRELAQNRLGIIGVSKMEWVRQHDHLLRNSVRRIALADSATPLGRISDAYLEGLGILDKLAPKLLRVDNSRAVLAAIASKTADVGLAFSSDANREGDWLSLFRIHSPKAKVTYEAAVVSRDAPAAEVLLLFNFLGTPESLRCLGRCGFQPINA
jgi:molybdenum ABC transporter molybdate-binding protein